MSDHMKHFRFIFALMLSVGIFVPLWGTFHSAIGLSNAWAAFASAALFFATGHKLEDSPKIAISHVLGVAWGLALLGALGRPELAPLGSTMASLVVLCGLGVLAVTVVHLGIRPLSHLPALFNGWAITVGSLGGTSPVDWGDLALQVTLSILCGVFVLGVGISQLHVLFCRLLHAEAPEAPKTTTVSKEKRAEGKAAGAKANPEEAAADGLGPKYQKYVAPYRLTAAGGPPSAPSVEGHVSEIKGEILELKNYLKALPSSSSGGAQGASVHVVAICGSPHKKGSTVAYLRKALEAARSTGNVSVELIELAGKNIKPCMGCKTNKCHDTCVIDDDMQQIYPMLRQADGLIVGSPSYFGTFSGQLKVFLDRLRVMRHTDFQLGNKVVAPLAVAGRRHGGQEITNLDIIQAMLRHNTIIVNENSTVCQLGATGWSHTFDDPTSTVEDDKYGVQTAEGVGLRIAEVCKVIKASGLQGTIAKYNAHEGKR